MVLSTDFARIEMEKLLSDIEAGVVPLDADAKVFARQRHLSRNVVAHAQEDSLTGSKFLECDLRFLHFEGFNLRNALFHRCRMRGANFTNGNLEESEFVEVDAKYSKWSGSSLTGSRLQNNDFLGAELSIADGRETDMTGCNLSSSRFFGASLQGAILCEADLSKCDFRGADLTGANLSGAKLENTDFSFSNLTGTIFERTDFANGVYCGVKLADAKTGRRAAGIPIDWPKPPEPSPTFLAKLFFVRVLAKVMPQILLVRTQRRLLPLAECYFSLRDDLRLSPA